jgi:subtilisin family serine protease
MADRLPVDRWRIGCTVPVGIGLPDLEPGGDMRNRILRLMAVAALVGLWGPGHGWSPADVRAGDDRIDLSGLPPLHERQPKLDSRLVAVEAAATSGIAAGVEAAREQRLTVSGGSVRVVVVAAASVSQATTAVSSVGGRVEATYADLVKAYVPVRMLGELAADPSVQYVRPPATAVPAVVDQGVAETNAASWQADGFTGTGVKVGVIDLGFIGYPAAQGSGDLPGGLTTADFGCGGVQTFTNHGTAVAEIVHDMAPDAQLYLICAATDVDLGLAKDYAITQGITIVNHSVVWINTARGDGSGAPGTPDAIVADAKANGILWVNGAGNHALAHWSGNFVSADGDEFHEFVSGGEVNQLFVASGATTCVYLKWDAWPTTTLDFDLILVRSSNLEIVAFSVNDQTGGTLPPTEALCYENLGAGQAFGVVIAEFQAASHPRFDLFVGDATQSLQFSVAAGSILEPASSPNAMAVGAICWQTDGLEPFSSRGPNIAGLAKPDIAGQDRTSTLTYGAANGCSAGFAGTSAAAPHVAGAAALVTEANPAFTPAQLQAFLEGRALDLGSVGKDNSFGWGRLWLGTAIPEPATGATYVPLDPARLLDTRVGTGLSGPFMKGVPRTFQITGAGGVPAEATAVTGNLTVTGMTAAGFVFLGPYPMANPPSSTLNFPVGDNRANGVTVALGAGGTLSATFNGPSAGHSTHLIFDVTGYFVPDTTGATFFPLDPARLLDTRNGTGGLPGALVKGVPQTFQVTGNGGVPAEATAVTGNLTATGMTAAGFVSLGPDPLPNPTSSTLNFPVGDNRANGVTVALGDDGSLSATFSGGPTGSTTHLIFDVTGYFVPGGAGAEFVPLTPARLLDSRFGNGLSGPFAKGVPRTFQVHDRGGVPDTATAITGNLTATGMTAAGFVSLGPDPLPNPPSSTLNFPVGDNRANGVTVALSGTGTLSATYNGGPTGSTTHLIFDVTGYFR